jgi:hypothetical protein
VRQMEPHFPWKDAELCTVVHTQWAVLAAVDV